MNMELQDIQNKLNILLSGTDRKIVFWYDDDAAYEEDIEQLELAPGNKKWVLTTDNWFETKLLLEVQDTTSNYLVYAPFSRPEDKENFLADIYYYSEHFYSDKMIQLCGDLGIPVDCQDEVKRFKKFWTATNTGKFQQLQIAECTITNIDLGIMCVLAGVKSCNFEELMRKILLGGVEDNPIIKKFKTNKIDMVFWQMCEKQYGYKDPSPSIQKFLVTMIMTYTDTVAEGNIPKAWEIFLSGKQNDVIVFVKNLMNNEETKSFYDITASNIAKELELEKHIIQIPLDNIVVSDAFEDFDKNIISWIIAKLEDGMLDEKIGGMTIPEICENRRKSCYHYALQFDMTYQMLYNGYKILKEVPAHQYQPTLEEVIRDYTENTYQIDTWYRKFYYCLDRVGMSENVEKIRDLVENMYTNKYLGSYAYKWNQSLTPDIYQNYTGTRQEDFYSRFVTPFLREGGREGRVIVIISDAFRYECAKELQRNLDLDEKCDAKMNHMLSVLPSETTLGMASLLPHREIVVQSGLDVVVDDMKCGNSMADRRKILQNSVKRADCYDFDIIKNAKQAEVREMLQDKDVVYIYQNQIDDRGESKKSENEVFNACQEAIDEIQKLIRKLTGYVSATRFLITADHGFIYKRDRLQEYDKISMDKAQISLVNKRYLLSLEPVKNEALVSRAMTYLGKLNQFYVTTPMGVDIIKAPGGGQNYVHGGSSLQEMIIPVVKVITYKGKQDTSAVNVELSYSSNRITDIMVYLDFMQMEAVTDTMKPRKLIAFFVDENGTRISYDVPIIADSTETDPRKRMMREKFILKSGNYSRGKNYYLVLAYMENEEKEHQRYRFEIDIAGTL